MSAFLLRLRRFFPERIAVKLAFVICVFVFALLSFLGITLTNITQSVLKTTIKDNHREVAVRASREVFQFVQRPVELLHTAAVLIGKTRTEAWDQETVLVEMSLDFPIFEEIVSVGPAGAEIATSNPGRPKKNYAEEKAFRAGREGEVYLSPIYIEKDFLPHLTAAVPYKQRGAVAGMLIAKVNLRGLWDIVDEIQIGRTGRAFLFSEDGLLIAHPDKRLVLKNTNLTGHPVFNQRKIHPSGSTEFAEEGVGFLASYAPVEGKLPLVIVIQMEAEEAYQLLKQIRLFIWAVLLVSLFLSIAVSFIAARRLVQPVKSLQYWSKKVALGNFDYRIPPKSLDEIGRLFIRFRRMSDRLKEAREKERFAALGIAAGTISHKLKNAIVSLKTFAQLLPVRKQDVFFMQKFERSFSSTILHLEKMFNNLSRISSSRKPLLKPVSLPFILESVYETYSDTLERKGIDFKLAVPPVLPEIQGDPDQLKELFTNLVQNAVQAMPHGGVLSLTVTGQPQDPFLQILVADTGAGVRPEDLNEIFKPFFTTKESGMGLGLSICKKIAEDHGGTISAKSIFGKGTVFTLRLPVTKSPWVPHPATAAPPPAPLPEGSPSSQKIMDNSPRLQ